MARGWPAGAAAMAPTGDEGAGPGAQTAIPEIVAWIAMPSARPSVLLLAAPLLALGVAASAAAAEALPERLSQTGLYADITARRVAPGIEPFSPQYPLWSDGAGKRRWLSIPAGRAIDASNPDAWVFPPGTRLWKEFSHAGRPVETRTITRGEDGRWQFATYVWKTDGSDALLAPPRGTVLRDAALPGGLYEVPARGDCLACHESAPAPVLGVGALQLSPDRDPLAPHAVAPAPGELDLPRLVAIGWLKNLPPALLAVPPRIAARTPAERAALGHLHGNCGHCHNDDGAPAPLPLVLAQRVVDAEASRARVLATTLGAPSRFRPAGAATDPVVIAAGQPEASVLALRMRTHVLAQRMPPIGTRIPDDEAVRVVERWIHDLAPQPRLTRNHQEH